MTQLTEITTLGGGCFWCLEAIFQQVQGVKRVIPGYAGGHSPNPDYKSVCSGTTGHAEVVQISFDPTAISFSGVLYIFWRFHDPTTLNRQGADIGTQYRSIILYQDDKQQSLARDLKKETDESDLWDNTIVTEIEPLKEFFEAEQYHHNYYINNPNQPYCSVIIDPKVEKLKKSFNATDLMI